MVFISHSLIIIPTRLASTRLPRKPLADINGKPMIQRVWECSRKATCDVLIASGDQEICDISDRFGARSVLTNPDHPSGSDRIYEALKTFDPDKHYNIIINYQGDIPAFDASILTKATDHLNQSKADILTFITKLDPSQYNNPNDVKAMVENPGGSGKALSFSRHFSSESEGHPFYHIGLYLYKREALEKFVHAKPTTLEKEEKLEQLRALSLGLTIETYYIDEIPLGVDTPEDLEKARKLLK